MAEIRMTKYVEITPNSIKINGADLSHLVSYATVRVGAGMPAAVTVEFLAQDLHFEGQAILMDGIERLRQRQREGRLAFT